MIRRHTLAALASVLVLAPLTIAHAQPAAATPEPFGKYIVYSAAAVYDPRVPPVEGDLATWFHRDIMGRDDAAFAAERAAADAYFTATFGALYAPDSLIAFAVDPRVAYTAYFVSGASVPPEGWVVRDGGFQAMLSDGTLVVYGDYNIKVTTRGRGRSPAPIVIHYESADPIHMHADGSIYFRCRLRSASFNDFGGGLAQGVSASQTLPDGRLVSNIRTVLTFPGLGLQVP
jgi:hypothetical protein